MVDPQTAELLRRNAAEYETAAFLLSDPSLFMHRVSGDANRETTAFVAAALSYGSRRQFMPKIQWLLDVAGGDIYKYVRARGYRDDIADSRQCFYRLYTCHDFIVMLDRLRQALDSYGSLRQLINDRGATDGLGAVRCITEWFAGTTPVIPKDTSSACKRLCMFLRWMVRDGSPVDLGLWADIIDKRTLLMPLDTHVVQEARRLSLLSTASATMTAARRLTDAMREVFPDDPLRGDFALYGYGIDADSHKTPTQPQEPTP